MQSSTGIRKSSASPLKIDCGPLARFDHTDLASVRRAFSQAPGCQLQQAWLDAEEPGFLPGEVRLGWRDNSILIFAELCDAEIFNHATALNQRTWELGDVFEIFLRPRSATAYVELQVTPDNQRLQLRYADADAVRIARVTKNLDHALVWGELFQSQTWKASGRWQVFAEIPSASVHAEITSLENSEWQFSFSRYDYTHGHSKPVISSTSPHAQADFHRTQEWGTVIFTIHVRTE
jgi:hypothetical protein